MEALDPHRRATITERQGRRWWRCENCQKTIGEIVGRRLVIIAHGRQLTFPAVSGLEQTCPACGYVNMLSNVLDS